MARFNVLTFIVLKDEGKAQVFETTGAITEVGRSEEMDLVLPDVSVSRHHARIIAEENEVHFEDPGSHNGVLINGERLEGGTSQRLQSGDKIQLGQFTLVLLKQRERFYKGRFIEYMMHYSPHATDESELATYRLSAAEIAALQRKLMLIENARVHLANNKKMFWHPEDRALTFGKDGMVVVGGLLTSSISAAITWEEEWHMLKKTAGISRVYANGEVILNHRLCNGDRFKVGDTDFVYMES